MAEQLTIFGTVLVMIIVDFKKMALEFKKFFGLTPSQSFLALTIAEIKLCEADSNFMFSIIADKDWNYKDSVQACYRHSANSHEIRIRESVYNKARSGNKQALYSIAHEISHWALLNYSGMDFDIKEYQQLTPAAKAAFLTINENIADLLTTLLIYSEEELLNAQSAGDLEYNSCMSETQISLALFYCKNYKMLVENFVKNFLPQFVNTKAVGRIE